VDEDICVQKNTQWNITSLDILFAHVEGLVLLKKNLNVVLTFALFLPLQKV
jgi:hypothetical protein